MAAITFTDAYRNLLREARKNGTNAQYQYIAAGTGTTAASASDTQLGAEVCRVAITTVVNGAAAGEEIVTGSIPSALASGTTFKEFGLFAGSSASSSPNTGTLVGRFLATQAHSGNVVQVQFDITGS